MSDEYCQNEPEVDSFGNYIGDPPLDDDCRTERLEPPKQPSPPDLVVGKGVSEEVMKRRAYLKRWREDNREHYNSKARIYRARQRAKRLISDPKYKPRPRLNP
jgi:hypothetical protein